MTFTWKNELTILGLVNVSKLCGKIRIASYELPLKYTRILSLVSCINVLTIALDTLPRCIRAIDQYVGYIEILVVSPTLHSSSLYRVVIPPRLRPPTRLSWSWMSASFRYPRPCQPAWVPPFPAAKLRILRLNGRLRLIISDLIQRPPTMNRCVTRGGGRPPKEHIFMRRRWTPIGVSSLRTWLVQKLT